MEELIARLDAEIAALQAEVYAVDASVADKRAKLHRLRQAKESLSGTSEQKSLNHAKRPYVSSDVTRERIAKLLEDRGSMSAVEIGKAIGVHRGTPYAAMRGHPWFGVIHGQGHSTTWALTEAGRSRHKTRRLSTRFTTITEE